MVVPTTGIHPARKPSQGPSVRPTQVYPAPQFGSDLLSLAYAPAIPSIGRKARIRSTGTCRPAIEASTPVPMAMLVVAAVLEAAMTTPSTTPSDRGRVVTSHAPAG